MNNRPENGDGNRSDRVEPARLIVWERHGTWSRHFRRLLAPDGVRVYESRTSEACREMISESPASILVAQLTPSVSAELSDLVIRFRREFPAVRTLAVADRTTEPLRWQLLETGIVWLCTSPRELGPILDIIRRHFEQVPRPPRFPEQRIWDELPWRAHSDAARP